MNQFIEKSKSQIFEYVFIQVLNKKIRKDFVPNNYRTLYTELELNQFGKQSELYFINKKNEIDTKIWDNELISDYKMTRELLSFIQVGLVLK